MLLWHGALYLIDHGAAVTFQHRRASADQATARPYEITKHALLGCKGLVEDAIAPASSVCSPGRVTVAVSQNCTCCKHQITLARHAELSRES